MHLKISDIVFHVSGDQQVDSLYLDGSCQDFICSGDPDVSVFGHYSGLPEILLRDEERIFTSDTFWQVHHVENKTIFVMRGPTVEPMPYCLAVFNPDFRAGDVYYHPSVSDSAHYGYFPHPLAFPMFHLLMISILSQGYGIFLHACGIDNRGRGYLFPGSSSNGKTTMARLWKDKSIVLNDERVILRQKEGRLWIYGTPWHGEYEKVSPHGVPLEKIIFLDGKGHNNASRLSNVAATVNLLKHAVLPYWVTGGMDFALGFCSKVASEIPCYTLTFMPDNNILDFIRCVK